MHTKANIEIVQVPISQLKPADYNPRKWDELAEEKLTESIKEFGLVDPIIANGADNRKNVVIGGHFRLHIAKKLGFQEVPVIYLDLPDLNKEKELNLRLNKNTGSWDIDLLKNFDTELLLDIGFTDVDLGDMWNDMLTIEDDEFDEIKELKKITETNIKAGDMFKLGRHRLICGNSMDKKIIERLMGDELADIVYNDPIYNINLDYNKGLGGGQNYGGTTNDKKSDAEYKEYLKIALINALAHAKKDLHVFSYCDQNFIWLVQELFKELGIKNQRVCLWIKNGLNLTPQVAFNKSFEPIVYGTVGKPYLAPIKNLTEIVNQEIGTGNRAIDDILDMLDVWLEKRLAGQDYLHPTSKPPTLHEKPLRRCSKIDDLVLDLYGGSGSTMVGCEQLKRRAYLVEIEPIFCQLILNRMEQLTGLKAELIN
ncbi:MAG: (Cytosine-5-)-methyltransferase protein [Parcubacteria group bacterium GW2011_GWE2_39_37]|uniref:Methyltransferase n=1 Tax=Candidatus Falkowbacteria bacterium GW2011_GWF2_39_8 TaxID=1618642 RepID=A0A0G0SGN6_9BACT|nr:MAG: (Cytosine-5-)-methyltransferase protein [Parcubacteria group bacterium GW2011_GWE2_39_37]KKR33875.1 MAG: (Cytosine-5-)-methyltransferase protein [Candidatus Falkowbacteria bacterium GW2011_GWF2_39_8]